MSDEPIRNILKTREDSSPVFFEQTEDIEAPTQAPFELSKGSVCSWIKPDESFGPEKLRQRIEPWLTALCQSEHLSLLLGSGLTNAVHRMGTEKGLPGMASAEFDAFSSEINCEVKRSACSSDRGLGNIEDQIRVANELLRGFEILSSPEDESPTDEMTKARGYATSLRNSLENVLKSFGSSILLGEKNILSAEEGKRVRAFNYLVSFIMSFASRTGTRDRLNIFTTNYDRVIEAGAEVAGLHLLDRFVGSLAPIFRSSRLNLDMHYNPPGIRGEPRYLEGVARFTKLHGSLDWIDYQRNIRRLAIPFGADEIGIYLKMPGEPEGDAKRLMIYPNSAKDRETAFYPYVELFRDFAAATCRPNHTLVTFGYGFGDDHINRIVEDMLTIPSTHLVIISYDDPLNRIMNTYEKIGRHAQISLLVGNHVGEFQSLVDNYLPKPAIDRTTFRMAELLKSRWGAQQREESGQSKDSTTEDLF